MARKSLKSNKARIAKQRRGIKVAQARKPWRIAGAAFCLGAIVAAGALVLTPLGAWCVTGENAGTASTVKCSHETQAVAGNKGSQPPGPEELARLVQAGAARNRRGEETESKKDPMAELRRIEAINARNRALLNPHTVRPPGSTGSHVHPHQPATPQSSGVPKPVIPTHNPTAAHGRRQ